MFGKRIVRAAAVGAAVALPLTLAATTPASAATKTATVTVLHAIPGSVLEGLGVAGGLVDICANGTTQLVNDLAPGARARLKVPPGDYTLTVHAGAAGCESGALLTTQASVAAGKNYTVTANLAIAGASAAPALNVFTNNQASARKTKKSNRKNEEGRVTIRHIAVAPAVDVFVDGNVAVEDLVNAGSAVPPVQAQTKLKKGTYQVAAGLANAGTAGIALGPIPLRVRQGWNVIAYAWGIPESAGGTGIQVALQYVKLKVPKK